MEIIHLILGKANPERMNGVNKVVHQLATQQSLNGKSVSVWGITRSIEHNYGERNFETRLFLARKNPFLLDPALKKALIGKKGQITVHLHGGWVPTYYSISAFLAAQGIPYVITPHGAYNSIARKRSSLRKRLYFRFFERKLLDHARMIHSIGESEVAGLAEIYPNSKSFLLPYGFSGKEEKHVARQPNHAFTVGFVGRIDIHTKGLDLLLVAFSRLLKAEPHARLWIIGDGREKARLEEMVASMGMQESVILWGGKFGEEKDGLMRSMDVFVHPSRNEGLPSAVLEAASLRIPCIVSTATNVAGFVSSYGAGISINDNSVDSLEDALLSMAAGWRAGQLENTGRQAMRMVEEAFSWRVIVDRFDHLYTT